MMRVRSALAAILCGVSLVSVGAQTSRNRHAAPPLRDAFQSAAIPTLLQSDDALVNTGGSVSAAFDSATTAGNLIVAYAIWDNTGPVTIADSRGNVYVPAGVGRTAWSGGEYSAQLFYARNINGGATTVTATFGTAASSFGILYVHEYAGLDKTAPLDGGAAAQGSSTTMSSAAVTTRSPDSLLFGAGASIGAVTSAGPGFTVRSLAHGNVTEDRNVTSVGSYAATATHSGGAWVMQIAAFKAERLAADTTPPSLPTGLTATAISSSTINLAWTASTDNVGVTGYRIYRNGQPVATTGAPSYQDAGLSASTTYTYAVEARDQAGNFSPISTSVSATTPPPADPSSCALPNHPTPDCTGVPAGTTFVRTIEGTYTASTPGEVIDRWHITGSLIVQADNVLITNSQIDDTVSNDYGGTRRSFTIMDSTVGPAVCGTSNWMPNGIGASNYTAIRVKVRGHEDGFRAAGPDVTVRDSYYRACLDVDSHGDGIQDYPFAQNLVFEHNTMDMANLTHGFNAPIYVNSVDTSDVRIVDNLVLGGVYSLYLQPTHGVWIVTGNRIVNGTWAYGASETAGLCANVTAWSDNTIVTIDANYRVTSTIRAEPCPQ